MIGYYSSVKSDDSCRIIFFWGLLQNKVSTYLSCDGLKRTIIPPGATVIVKKKSKTLQLIHPLHYDYYQTLRDKLHWQKQLKDSDQS